MTKLQRVPVTSGDTAIDAFLGLVSATIKSVEQNGQMWGVIVQHATDHDEALYLASVLGVDIEAARGWAREVAGIPIEDYMRSLQRKEESE